MTYYLLHETPLKSTCESAWSYIDDIMEPLPKREPIRMKPDVAMEILNDPKDRTRDLIIESMQCLIDSGWIWSATLHDGYRKAALAMIDAGVCHVPDWAEGSIE
jgi:hypothetical protein